MSKVAEFRPAPVQANLVSSRRLSVVSDDACPPSDLISQWCRQGGVQIDLDEEIGWPSTGKAAEAFLDRIRLLRDSTACGVPVRWTAASSLQLVAAHLSHVTPPLNANDVGLSDWCERHRFGSCYWRRGPGFISIVDRRSDAGSQFVLDTPDHLETFLAAQLVVSTDRLVSLNRQALSDLEQEGLILSTGGWSVALPFRISRWPVPFNAI